MDEGGGSSLLGERGSEASLHGTSSVIADLQLSVNTGWTLNMAYLIFCTQRSTRRIKTNHLFVFHIQSCNVDLLC